MIETLHHLYRPVQPVFENGTNGAISYHEHAPHPLLSDLISCYWELQTNHELDKVFQYRVIAEGCSDFSFLIPGFEKCFFGGADSSYAMFPILKSFHIYSIKFIPGAFSCLYNLNAFELFREFVPIDDVLPRVYSELKSLLCQALEMNTPFNLLLDNYFLKKTADFSHCCSGKRFFNEISNILVNNRPGTLRKAQISMTPQHLRRLSNYYLGMSPKDFLNIVRFQHCYQTMCAEGFKKSYKNQTYFDFGYYDQSHFIHDFKQKFGLQPSETFKTNTYLL